MYVLEQVLDIEYRLKKLKPVLQKKFKVKSIGYFGSQANNTATGNSDIDLLVEFSEPPGWEFLQLKFFLEKHLKKPVDLVTNRALKKPLKKTILNEVKYI